MTQEAINLPALPEDIFDNLTEEVAQQIADKMRGVLSESIDVFMQEAPKLTTKTGRGEYKSAANKIVKKRGEIEAVIGAEMDKTKALMADHEARLKGLRLFKKTITTTFNEYRDRVKQPAIEWEENDKQRIANHEARLQNIITSGLPIIEGKQRTAASLEKSLARCDEFELTKENCEEYLVQYTDAIRATKEQLSALIPEAKQREADAAELEALRLKNQADAQARQQVADAEAAKQRAEQQAEQAKKDAEAERIRADERAKQQAEQAKKDAEQAALQARADEQAKAKAQADKEAADKLARESNLEHTKQVNRAILSDLMQFAELDEETAKKVLTVIYRKQIRRVNINY